MISKFLSRNYGKVGSLYTWGNGYHTNLGHDDEMPCLRPKKVETTHRVPSNMQEGSNYHLRRTTQPLKAKFKIVKTGMLHTAAISETGQLYTFGNESYNKLGFLDNPMIPGRVLGLIGINVVDVALALDSTLALTDNGRVFTWGYGGETNGNLYAALFKEEAGALGLGDLYNYSVPTAIPNFEDVIQIEAGFYHGLGLTKNGHVYSWGNNEFGELGVEMEFAKSPVKIDLEGITKISAAANYSVALNNFGDVWVWGRNHYGQLGVKEEKLFKPYKLTTGARDIEAGEGCLMIVKNNELYLAGLREFYELTHFPTQSVPIKLSCGDDHAEFVAANGLVYAMGGLFSEKPQGYFFHKRNSNFSEAPAGFFTGKILHLAGKYNYHAAVLED
ncbi:unnamed protein product [Blepharisma stoltei]|uniref:RCC1-like domain-containing protein n=1 Tax=Blepharisma stoltei TaxID=1481888 RepID=A0AAU9K3B3_9CILI|nr:unnamed protein product [Blepharisma stoltei]